MMQLKRMATPATQFKQVTNTTTAAKVGLLTSRTQLNQMNLRAKVVLANPAMTTQLIVPFEQQTSQSGGVYGGVKRSLRNFSTQNSDPNPDGVGEAPPNMTPSTSKPTEAKKERRPRNKASRKDKVALDFEKDVSKSGRLFNQKEEKFDGQKAQKENKKEKVQRGEEAYKERTLNRSNKQQRYQKYQMDSFQSGSNIFGDALKKSKEKQDEQEQESSGSKNQRDKRSKKNQSSQEQQDRQDQDSKVALQASQGTTEVVFEDEQQQMMKNFVPRQIQAVQSHKKGSKLTEGINWENFVNLKQDLAKNQKSLNIVTKNFQKKGQQAQNSIDKIQQRKNRAYFENTLLPYWQNEHKLAEYQLVKLYELKLIDNAKIKAYIKREVNEHFDPLDSGYNEHWFDWQTFKEHVYESKFDDLRKLEADKDREDDIFWDNLAKVMEKENDAYNEVIEEEDKFEENNITEEPSSSPQTGSLIDSNSALGSKLYDDSLYDEIVVDDADKFLESNDLGSQWAQAKDEVFVEEWEGAQDDPTYQETLKRIRMRDLITNYRSKTNDVGESVYQYRQVDPKAAQMEFQNQEMIGVQAEINNDETDEDEAEYGVEDIVENTDKIGLIMKKIEDLGTNEEIRANDPLDFTPFDYLRQMHIKARTVQDASETESEADLDDLPLEFYDEPGVMEAEHFIDDSAEELDEQEMGYYQMALKTQQDIVDSQIRQFFQTRAVLRFLSNVSPEHLQPYVVETPDHLYQGDDYSRTQAELDAMYSKRAKTVDGEFLNVEDYLEAEDNGVRILHHRKHAPKSIQTNSTQVEFYMTALDTHKIGFSELPFEEQLQNFYNTLRNRYAMSKPEFREKLAIVLGDVDSESMPEEFKEYFAELSEYSEKHPSRGMLHKMGWENFADLDNESQLHPDLKMKYDYTSEKIPDELKSTFEKYYNRKVGENISQIKSQDPKVNELIEFMKQKIEQKERISSKEIRQIAKLINKIDQKYGKLAKKDYSRSQRSDRQSADRARVRRQMDQFQNKLKDLTLQMNQSNEQVTNKKITKLSAMQYKSYHRQALQQMNRDFPKMQKLMTQYGLDEDEHFAALITDMFVNTSRQSLENKNQESSLLLNRFSRLLQLLDEPANFISHELLFDEIRKAFRPTDATETELLAFQKLSQDRQFVEKFTLMQLAKLHNKYGMVDNYMRSFAKCIINTRKSGHSDLADKLEQMLNSEIILKDPSKETLAHLSSTQWQEKEKMAHQTADYRIIRQKEFQFLPKFAKINRLQERDQLQHELKKTQELREMLDWNCDVHTQQKLMQSFDGVQQILKHIDQGNHIQDKLEFQRLKKVELTLNELASQLFSNTLDMQGINWNNMEQVFNPLYSGVLSVAQQKQELIQKGLSEQMADKLATQYLNGVYDTGNQYSILEFFSNQKAKMALHGAEVTFDDMCFNFTKESTKYGHHDLESFKSQLTAPKRMQPIRPSGGLMGSISARLFSSGKTPEELAQEQDLELKLEKKSKFLDFLRTAETLDNKILDNPDLEKQVGEGDTKEEPLVFSSPDDIDLDISFSRSGRNQEQQLFDETNLLESDDLIGGAAIVPSAAQKDSNLISEVNQRRIRSAEEEAWQVEVQKAKKRYDPTFFEQFAERGPYAEYMTQRAIEDYITNELTESEDIVQFVTSLINSAYEINHIVPNAEQMFFNIFCSPVTTAKMRKGKDSNDLLHGNLFKQNDLVLPKQIYRSLIETVALKPKKKHYKKIIEHILTYQNKENFDPQVLDMLIFVGIQENYPLTLGKTVKYLLQNDYPVNKESFKEFYLFLERCKGFEEDAKRFILMTNESKQIQLDYDLIRPFFVRTMKKKSGQEVLKLFEQFRKGLKLNQSHKSMSQEDKFKLLREIKKDFYDGLIKDLIDLDAYQLAQIVFGEKIREKYETTLHDQMIALQIYASQGRMSDYRIKFLELTDENSTQKLDNKICEQIAGTLTRFKEDQDKPMVIDMLDTLMSRVLYQQTHISSKFFDSMITVFVDGQQFDKIVTLLSSVSQKNCTPEPQIMKYLKRNMMYIFDKNQKDTVRNAIDGFEKEFFSLEAMKKKQERAQIQEIRSMQREKEVQKEAESESESITIDITTTDDSTAAVNTENTTTA